MDVPEPDQTPFTAVTAQTSKLTRVSVRYLLYVLTFMQETFYISKYTDSASITAISSLSRCLHSVYPLSMVGNWRSPDCFLSEDHTCAGLVYWYATPMDEFLVLLGKTQG